MKSERIIIKLPFFFVGFFFGFSLRLLTSILIYECHDSDLRVFHL